ncbi:MAG: NADH-quinone oxidoreductase subunit C, partial [Bdellovibrionales bacterium]|nr:NADH-quinone oxidoreductase subunit C [Bdellovibrionales bacterium]
MNQIEEIRQDLSEKIGPENVKMDHMNGDDILNVPPSKVREVVEHFKLNKRFDFLMDVCGADYPEREKRFDVVYNFYSSKDNRRLRMKTQVGENESLPSVTPVWKGANFFERETFDMFGIKFDGHPYLKRILLHEEFVG